jgi:1,2-diacylglycerol 3-alpha-glucosyltransferase
MNIGLFTDCYNPAMNGVVSSIVQLKAELEGRGHKVIVFTVTYPNMEKECSSIYRFSSIPFRSDIGIRIGLPRYRHLRSIVRQEQVDLIHTHTEFSMGWMGKRIARNLGLPHIHTAHTIFDYYRHYSLISRGLRIPWIQYLLHRFLIEIQAVICPSAKMKHYLAQFAPSLATTVIKNGANQKQFNHQRLSHREKTTLRSQYGIFETDQVMLFVGRLGKEKRVLQLFDQLKDVLKKRTLYKLLIIGDGPLKKELHHLVDTHQLQQQVIMTGNIKWEHINQIYQLADVFVTVSLSEVCPMTLIEACMSGLPIIARRDPGITDLVINGQNGLLVDSDSQFGNTLWGLLNNQNQLNSFSNYSQILSKQFNIDQHTELVEALYQNTIHHSNAIIKKN